MLQPPFLRIDILLKSEDLVKLVFCEFLQFIYALLFIVVPPENGVQLRQRVFVLVDGPLQGIVLVDQGLIFYVSLLKGRLAGGPTIFLIIDYQVS